MGDKINKMRRATHRLTQELNREPSHYELATALKMTLRQVEDIVRFSRHPLSLERPLDVIEDAELGDFVEDEDSPTPEEVASEDLLKDDLVEILNALPPRESKVLKLRYGLLGYASHTLKEVGIKMGVTRERVRQIEAQALRRLRDPRLKDRLQDYLRS